MPTRCLRCGRSRAIRGWQCSDCESQFPPLTERDRAAVLRFLDEQDRALARAADRLDGAGFWAAAKAAWRAEERVVELSAAIAEEERAT